MIKIVVVNQTWIDNQENQELFFHLKYHEHTPLLQLLSTEEEHDISLDDEPL